MKALPFFIFCCSTIFLCKHSFAQGGITASPAKIYYHLPAGTSGTQNVKVINPNTGPLEVGVSLGDWDYKDNGDNRMLDPGTLKTSCASWIKILPGSFFTMAPDEQKELLIELSVPKDADTSLAVHTAMLYLTQLNPSSIQSQSGASLKVSVRMGIKIYHSFSPGNKRDIEVVNFVDKKDVPKTGTSSQLSLLEITIENTGKMWLDGKVKWELLNQGTGEKTKLPDLAFLSLPGDQRICDQALPKDLKKGRYVATAIINYGDKDELKIVELDFEH